jgi:hypothetical protein
LRCLKRRLSDAVYRCLLTDQRGHRPGGRHQLILSVTGCRSAGLGESEYQRGTG